MAVITKVDYFFYPRPLRVKFVYLHNSNKKYL